MGMEQGYEQAVLNKFLEAGLNVEPEVIDEILKNSFLCNEAPDAFADRIIKSADKAKCILTLGDLIFSSTSSKPEENQKAEKEKMVIRNIAAEAMPCGDISGFAEYFRTRYAHGIKAFQERAPFRNFLLIEDVKKLKEKEEGRTLGMVNGIGKTKNGNIRIELEDSTSTLLVIVKGSDAELVNLCTRILCDEVIGVIGVYLGKEKDIFIAKEIFQVDIPVEKISKKNGTGEELPAIAMISDIHVGSKKSMKKEFLQFLMWLKGKIGDEKQKKLAEKVKYLVIAGDLVEGVGIYPGQRADLEIDDIYRQYEEAAHYLEMVPDGIEIVIAPGNHDATRQAEPQPAIFEDFAPRLYENKKIHMVGNPCYLEISGVNMLLYHGRSLDDVIARIPGMSYNSPVDAMLEMLKKRILVPVFGEKVPVAPHSNDCLFIKEVPDILHCGHVHVAQAKKYRWVNLVNSGAFQTQTEYQKRLNMVPLPARVPVFDAETRNITIMKFA